MSDQGTIMDGFSAQEGWVTGHGQWIRLVAVEIFGVECHHHEEPEPFGYGLCDAVSAWSDCNRADGHIFRVDDVDPAFRDPNDVVRVWVPAEELEKLSKNWRTDNDLPPNAVVRIERQS